MKVVKRGRIFKVIWFFVIVGGIRTWFYSSLLKLLSVLFFEISEVGTTESMLESLKHYISYPTMIFPSRQEPETFEFPTITGWLQKAFIRFYLSVSKFAKTLYMMQKKLIHRLLI